MRFQRRVQVTGHGHIAWQGLHTPQPGTHGGVRGQDQPGLPAPGRYRGRRPDQPWSAAAPLHQPALARLQLQPPARSARLRHCAPASAASGRWPGRTCDSCATAQGRGPPRWRPWPEPRHHAAPSGPASWGHQAVAAVALTEVGQDGLAVTDHHLAIEQHRHLAKGVQRARTRAPCARRRWALPASCASFKHRKQPGAPCARCRKGESGRAS